ncbi:D-hexose-6-phosphate mutarotase [Aromatoleum petrolei]|uniref:Putative glucose-6-phosphate 1-epimerase n=1 Tax=Aromatoleum petrolei TaxID=76116 RepID=A0ABX1MPA2_9RHOO|nr:D-hexose-6-phosphate mutarotase [Aromatoleum petrolei]NMF89779.1 D-hexose-6-phosphate mutarotase [Aromatoleum petrolei]QTQ35040.1 Putative glucose-6-phosphate 1-epimerase [Aromatoleum petrolei]
MPANIETIDFHDQPAIALTTQAGARAIVSIFGAQVLSWIPAGGQERLYLSPSAIYDGSTAIRGGIPVCFPQFAGLGKLPKHGILRTHPWVVAEQRTGDDFALVTLRFVETDDTWAIWPKNFVAELTVVVEGERLDVEFEVENTGHAPFAFTAALHTYLRVHEVENARLEGLYGHEYRDSADHDRIKRDSGDVVVVENETDRVYHDVKRPLLLRDGSRSLGINAEGFPDVVVWNPWEERCAALADMPANGFRYMLCVEAAAARQRIELDAGENWVGRQSLIAL